MAASFILGFTRLWWVYPPLVGLRPDYQMLIWVPNESFFAITGETILSSKADDLALRFRMA